MWRASREVNWKPNPAPLLVAFGFHGQHLTTQSRLVFYRYFVDLGNFRNEERSTDAFSDAKNISSTDPQQKGKRSVFPESTNYRYSDVLKD